MCVHMSFFKSLGISFRKTVQDARVNEDDGIIQLDTLAHLVYQAVPIPRDYSDHHDCTVKGMCDVSHVMCVSFDVCLM